MSDELVDVIDKQWFSSQELRGIYESEPERLSYPLTLCCEQVLGLGN